MHLSGTAKNLIIALATSMTLGATNSMVFAQSSAATSDVAQDVISSAAQSILATAQSGDVAATSQAIMDVFAHLNKTYPNVDEALAIFEQVLFLIADAAASDPTLRTVMSSAFELASATTHIPAVKSAFAAYATVIQKSAPSQTLPQPTSVN